MQGFVIEEASIEVCDEIKNFFEMVLRHTFEVNMLSELEDLILEEIEDKRRCLNQCFETMGQDRYFLIASLDGKVIGCIEYGLSNKLLNDCTNNELKNMLEVGTIFVHPDYQSMGIGSKLISAIFDKLLSDGVKQICFDSGYKTAQRIWTHKFGEPRYFLKDYWSDGSHHMVWVVNLKDYIRSKSIFG